jgi:hypothetical protein
VKVNFGTVYKTDIKIQILTVQVIVITTVGESKYMKNRKRMDMDPSL